MRSFLVGVLAFALLLTATYHTKALALSCPAQVQCPYDGQTFYSYAWPKNEGGVCTCKFTHQYNHVFYTYCEE